MRKIILSLLLASAAAAPGIAQAQDSAAERRAAREQARQERASAREDRSSAREERSAPQVERRATREERAAAREERAGPAAGADTGASRPVIRQPSSAQERAAANDSARAAATEARQQRSADRAEQRSEARAERQARYAAIREARRNAAPPPVSRTPQPNTQPPPPTTSRPSSFPHWSSAWRHNSRYDWYNWRRKNRWLFNLGFYYDPFGWGYSPFSIGWRMWPSYYSHNYWLNDPWQYRLPYAPPGTRWIRYYDDAILVDMWNGQVLDVIYDFFW